MPPQKRKRGSGGAATPKANSADNAAQLGVFFTPAGDGGSESVCRKCQATVSGQKRENLWAHLRVCHSADKDDLRAYAAAKLTGPRPAAYTAFRRVEPAWIDGQYELTRLIDAEQSFDSVACRGAKLKAAFERKTQVSAEAAACEERTPLTSLHCSPSPVRPTVVQPPGSRTWGVDCRPCDGRAPQGGFLRPHI